MNTKIEPDFAKADYSKSLLRLFKPGNGISPPCLAGRDEAMAIMSKGLMCIKDRCPPASDIVLTGPRGNGKTVLLTELENRAEDAGLDVVILNPSKIETRAMLARQLTGHGAVPENLLNKALPDSVQAKLPGLLQIEWKAMTVEKKSHYSEQHLEAILGVQCQHKPMLVTLDEAHTLGVEVGKRLLNLSQEIRRTGRAPFLLVMAGTPNLARHLNRMDATFWNRSEKIGVGLLQREAAEQALQEPLEGKGISMERASLDQVVADSQGYPYFIQIWGEALCGALVKNRETHVNGKIVVQARQRAEKSRDSYYKTRYQEMDEFKLLPAAVTVGEVFKERTEANTEYLKIALQSAGIAPGDAAAAKLIAQLCDLDYLWSAPEKMPLEPGIPSLMSYVEQHRQA